MQCLLWESYFMFKLKQQSRPCKVSIFYIFHFRLAQATKFYRPLTSMQLSSSWFSVLCSESSSSEVRNSIQNDLETWFLPPTRTWFKQTENREKKWDFLTTFLTIGQSFSIWKFIEWHSVFKFRYSWHILGSTQFTALISRDTSLT